MQAIGYSIVTTTVHLQGGFSVCSFKDGASVLPMSILREEDYEDFLTKSTSSFDDSPRSAFFPAKVSGAWVFSE